MGWNDSAMGFHRAERAALADALEEAGPGAPTLCAGWASEHLAAHVVLRETAPLLAAGAVVPALADRTERAVQALGDRSTTPTGWADLIGRVRRGPGRWHPLELLGDAAQLVELFVHTEDVRRGGPDPHTVPVRPRADAHTDALWRGLTRMAGVLYKDTGLTVGLEEPGGRRHRTRSRGPAVVVRGDVGDLLLHAFGRSTASRVTVEGTEDARARMARARPA